MSARGSVIAKLALVFGWSTLFLIAVGFATAHFGLLPPYTGFRVFASGLAIAGPLAALLGFFGWLRGTAETRKHSFYGLLLGLIPLLAAITLLAPNLGAPPIHDITTNPEDPPELTEAQRLSDNRDRDLTYPHGGADVIAQQRSAYPDLQPVTLNASPQEAFEAARQVAEQLGWTILWANAELGLIEAYEVSKSFRFVDDIVIRIRPHGSGSLVDIRSTSRVGISDLGANAKRIRRFIEGLARTVS